MDKRYLTEAVDHTFGHRRARYETSAVGDSTQRRRSYWHETAIGSANRARTAIAVFVMLLSLSVAGCAGNDSPEARFDDYLSRLARTLDVARPALAVPTARLYPAKRDLQLPVEAPRTGWIGLFQLHRCGLVNLVSERNSILGRVAPAHERLAYESELLAGLLACRADLASEGGDDVEFSASLDELIAIKRQAVPRIFWNRTLGGDGAAHLFSLAGRPPSTTPTAAGRDSRAALEVLTQAGQRLANGATLRADELASTYQRLENSTYGGQLQRAAIDAAAALNTARTLIERRLARRPICFNGQPSRRGRTLQTILLEVYGPRVQAYLADLVRAGRQWRATVSALVGVQRVPIPSAWGAYRQATLAPDRGVWAQLDTAIRRHTERWQDMLGDCSLMPGHDAK